MGFEIPTDLIRQVQIALRKDAGLSSYDSHDPNLPALPSLRESVAGFDPSPPYLRCENCKGRLLRGLQSVICVYCGKRQSKDVPPDPIPFKSTFGYQWLLQSLDLDGSETVGPSIEKNQSNRGRSTPKDKILLSDLLNIKLTLPDESEKTESSLTNSVPIQSTSSLNYAVVNLDDFFAESRRRDLISNSLEEQPVINKQSENVEMNAFASQTDTSLFQNVQHSETAVSSSEVKIGDTFSGWEADFQFADSGNQHEGSGSFDPFVGSTVDLSAHMDSVFGPGKDLEDEKPKDASTSFASATNDGIQDDLQNNSDFSSFHPVELVDAAVKSKDSVPSDNIGNHSSPSIDCFPDDQWQTSTTAPDNTKISEGNDSFDVWNDFRTSTSAQDTSKNSSTQSGSQIAAVDEQTSDITLSSSTNNFQEMDFGSFSQPDLFSGSVNEIGSEEANDMDSEGPAIDRMADLNDGGNVGQAAKDGDISNSTTEAKDDDIERVLSQMTDLSFMLESDLSVPSNKII